VQNRIVSSPDCRK